MDLFDLMFFFRSGMWFITYNHLLESIWLTKLKPVIFFARQSIIYVLILEHIRIFLTIAKLSSLTTSKRGIGDFYFNIIIVVIQCCSFCFSLLFFELYIRTHVVALCHIPSHVCMLQVCMNDFSCIFYLVTFSKLL